MLHRSNTIYPVAVANSEHNLLLLFIYYLLQVIYKAKQPVTPDQQVKKVQVD